MELTLLLPLLASLQSLPRPVSPSGPPAVPTLSLSPQDQLYLSGESVQLTCSPPRDAKAATIFQFYKDGGGIFLPAVPPGSSDTNVRNLELGLGRSGSYTCRYWTDPDGQEFQSAESPPVRITVRDPLLAPSLSLEPRYQVYFPREQVTLTCAALRNESVSGYRFYFQHEEQEPSTVLSSNVRARLEVTAEKRSAGTYTCAYWRQGSNGSVSENSSSISITVTDTPVPTLSLSPSNQLYLSGESVQLTCSAPSDNGADTSFQFYKDRGDIFPPAIPPSSIYSNVRNLELRPGDSGSYTCRYWTDVAGRVIHSAESPSVPINVTDPPEAPMLSLEPSHRVYLPGDQMTLTCAAPRDTWASGYRFYFQNQWQEPSTVQHFNAGAQLLLRAEKERSGSYICAYWRRESNREISSGNSSSISITVRDRPSPPKLTVSPQHRVLLRGESVTLTCSSARTATMSKIRFFRDGQRISSGELQWSQKSVNASVQLSNVSESHAGEYRCEYWQTESGREIPSERSKNITIKVIDPPPQPVLSVDPPSGVLSERLPLLFTCTVPGSARDRRFHFYKNGDKFDPGDMGSEHSTSEPTNSFRNISVLSITRAGPNNTGEFTCGYEQKVGKRWILSLRSQAVTVTLSASPSVRDILLGTGGVLLLIAALAALLCYCHRKKRVPKTPKSTAGSALGERTRNLDPGHDSKGSKAMGAGAEQMEQGSDVTYALLVLPTSQAHKTLSKNKAKPAEDEHVVYSKVVTTRTQKVAK